MTVRLNKSSRSWSGVSLAVLTASIGATAAQAQDAAQDPGTTVEEVVVVGQRLANLRAVQAKQNAAVILDVLAADDLNRLPDQNLAEALSRVAGVTAFQDEGAGLYVGLRGLNQEFVSLTIDGLDVSSAARIFDNNLRGANLEAVPSSFVTRVEVIKAATPDLDGDAIAGTVNLVSRSALDRGGSWFSMGAAGGQYQEDVPADDIGLSGKGNVSFGTTLADDPVGLVFDAHFRTVARDNLKPNAWFGGNGDGSQMPDEVGGFFYQRQEDSWGANAKFELRPNRMFQGYVSLSYFDSDTTLDKEKHALFGAVSQVAAGTFTGAQGTLRTDRVTYGVDDSLTVAAGADLFLGERNTVAFRASTSTSTAYQDDPRVDWFYGGPLSGQYAFDGQTYAYQLNTAGAAAFVNPALYSFNGYRRFEEELVKGVDVVRLDWTNASPDGRGLSYKAGFKWKSTPIDYTSSSFRWRNPRAAFNWGQYLSVFDYRFPGPTNDRILHSDITGVSDTAEGLGAAGFSRVESLRNGNDYRVAEDVTAAYALIDYAGERFRFIGGVRYEGTQTDAATRRNRVDDAPFVETSGDYGDWLPSAALTYFVDEQWLVRAGVSRSIGRPDVRDLARGETPPNDSGVFSRGNPDLQPRRSTNYDLSVEHYFDGGSSLVSVAVFRKELQDEIYDLQTPYTFIDDLGAPIPSFYIQPENGGDAWINGVELSLVKNRLDFLPGPLADFGVTANLTFTDGELDLLGQNRAVVRTVAPEGLSKTLGNVTLYYQGERLSARAAYRYVGAQTQSLSIDGSADVQMDAYQQTDLHVAYKLGGGWELFGEVWNAFEDEQGFTSRNAVAGVPNWFEDVRYGRAVWVGLNFKL